MTTKSQTPASETDSRSDGTYLYYCFTAVPGGPRGAPAVSDYECAFWRPTFAGFKPRGLPWLPFVVWWLFHHLRLFWNDGYSIFTMRRGGQVCHRSCIFPGYFRFPFMDPADLQVGDTLTDPTCRGQGLATVALERITRELARPGRRIWYVVETGNVASIRVAEKAGFARVATGYRTKRFGLRLLGSYVTMPPLPGSSGA